MYPGEDIDAAITAVTPATEKQEIAGEQKRRWTERDDHILVSMLDEGRSHEEIAKVLCRTPKAVTLRLCKAGKPKKQIAKQAPVEQLPTEQEVQPQLVEKQTEQVPRASNRSLPQTDAVYGLTVERLFRLEEGRVLWCKLKAAEKHIESLIALYGRTITRHPDAADSFAEVFALVTMDALKGAGNDS